MERKIMLNWLTKFGTENTSYYIGSIHNNNKIDIEELKKDLVEMLKKSGEKEVQFLLFTHDSVVDGDLCVMNIEWNIPNCSLTLVDITKMDKCENPLLKKFLEIVMSDVPSELKQKYPDMDSLIDKYTEDINSMELEQFKKEKK